MKQNILQILQIVIMVGLIISVVIALWSCKPLKRIFIEGWQSKDNEGDQWIKVKKELPKKDGLYKVKRAFSDNEEYAEYTSMGFTNYHGYRVTEWLKIKDKQEVN